MLVSASGNGTIKLWDTKLGQLKQTIKKNEGVIRALSYNPNGSVLAFGARDGIINFLDGQLGRFRQRLKKDKRNNDGVLTSVSNRITLKILASTMLKTRDLFDKYDPKQVSAALQFLWEMGLANDNLTFVYKLRTPSLFPIQGHYYSDTQFLPLLDCPQQGKTKMDQLIQWLEDRHAYKAK